MSGFGLGQVEFIDDDDGTDIDRTFDNPDFDWTPLEGDDEETGSVPPPPDDNAQDEITSTAPGTNLIEKPSFESQGPWSGWEHPYAWDYAYHGLNVARIDATGSQAPLTSTQSITIDPASTYWVSGFGWMERYTTGAARLLLDEKDAYGTVLNTHVIGEWNEPTSHYASVLSIPPTSYYRCGEASGSYVDTMGSINGTAVGTHTRNVTGVLVADTDGATRLPGSTGAYIDLGDNFDFTGNAAFTVAGWVKSEDFTGSMHVIGKESTSSPDSGWYVSVEGGTYAKFVRYNVDDGFTEYELRNTPEEGFETGKWYHIAATWDGTEGALYVNGVNPGEDPTGDLDVLLLDSTTTARIGANWDGDLDEFTIWQYDLSASELGVIYNSRLAQWENRSVRFRVRALTQEDVAWDPDVNTVSLYADLSGNPVFDFRLDGLFLAAGEQAPTGVFTDAASSDHADLTNVLADQHHAQDHQARHNSGGADALKLDDLATPDDNTDLDATTGLHGLLPKLGGGSTNYLRADGTWAEPPGAGASLTVREADGTPSVSNVTQIDFDQDVGFTVTDETGGDVTVSLAEVEVAGNVHAYGNLIARNDSVVTDDPGYVNLGNPYTSAAIGTVAGDVRYWATDSVGTLLQIASMRVEVATTPGSDDISGKYIWGVRPSGAAATVDDAWQLGYTGSFRPSTDDDVNLGHASYRPATTYLRDLDILAGSTITGIDHSDIGTVGATDHHAAATSATDETTFGLSNVTGVSTDFARSDHRHGTPTDPAHSHPYGPDDADYLVGTANGSLSGEIVVGTSPGGELGGTWASPTIDATHSGSAHHAEAHEITTAGPHTLTGGTVGDVLRVSGATSAVFATLAHGDLSDAPTDAHHAEVHTVASTGPHAQSGLTAGHVMRASAAAAFDFAALQAGDIPALAYGPDNVDYLVGTASGGLSAEIVVGTTPQGELGGTWASPTIDTTHSGTSHANIPTQTAALNMGGFDISNIGDLYGEDLFLEEINDVSNGTAVRQDNQRTTGGALQDNDEVAIWRGRGHDGTGYLAGAEFKFRVDGTVATNDLPTEIVVMTNEGAASATEQWRWAPAGHFEPITDSDVNIGTASIRVATGYFDTVDAGTALTLATGSASWEATPSTQAHGDSAAAGTAVTFARGDHKHAMPAAYNEDWGEVGDIDAITFGQAAAAGVLTEIARADHAHAMVADPVTAHEAAGDPHTGYLQESVISALATPAIVLGTAAAAGTGTTPIRHNSTIVAFDATVPVTQAYSDSAATGSAAVAARRDHVHGMPAEGAFDLTVAETDNVPSVSNVDTIDFDQADGFSVTDDTGGVVTIGLSLTASDVGAGPDSVDYLVGTASGGLSAEIVVGTSPGGELGGTWASPTVDTTHSGSAHHTKYTDAEAVTAVEGEATLDLQAVTANSLDVSGTIQDSAGTLAISASSDITFAPAGKDIYPTTDADVDMGISTKRWQGVWAQEFFAMRTDATPDVEFRYDKASGGMASGVALGYLRWYGDDGVTSAVEGARIGAVTTEAWGATAHGSELRFYTVENTETAVTQQWEIQGTGQLAAIGTGANLNMNGRTLYSPLDPTTGTHVGDRDYNDLRYADIANEHAEVHTVASTGPHAQSGLTAGHVLRASAAAAFDFAALVAGDIPAPGGELGGTYASTTVNATHSGSAHHSQSHVLSGGDHTASGLTTGWAILADSATTFSWQALPAATDHNQNISKTGGSLTLSTDTGRVTLQTTETGVAQFALDDAGWVNLSDSANDPTFYFDAEKATPTASGSNIGEVRFRGLNASGSLGEGASIGAYTTGLWSDTDYRSEIRFATTPASGTSPVNAWEIASDGGLISTTADGDLGATGSRVNKGWFDTLDSAGNITIGAQTITAANWLDLTDAGETTLHTHPGGTDLSGIDFLVGTASGLLSAEIVVGTTPNGELGGTWGAITVDATHSGSAHHTKYTDAEAITAIEGEATLALSGAITSVDSITFGTGTGTGAEHGIRFDTDTGLYSTGDGNLTFEANNQTQLVITSSGTTISDNLDLNGTLTGSGVPGGELGGTWDSITVDATHSGSAHTNIPTQTDGLTFAASGYAYLELNGVSGSYIDFHGTASTDYGVRLIETDSDAGTGGGTLSVNGGTLDVNAALDIGGHVTFAADSTYDIGTTGVRPANIYADTMYSTTIGGSISAVTNAYISTVRAPTAGELTLQGGSSSFVQVSAGEDLRPETDGSGNIGTTSKRWAGMFTDDMDIDGTFVMNGHSSVILGSDTTNDDYGTTNVSGFDNASAYVWTITGLANFAEGRTIWFRSSTGGTIILKHEDTGSTAANRFSFPGGRDVIIDNDSGHTGYTTVRYEIYNDRWVLDGEPPTQPPLVTTYTTGSGSWTVTVGALYYVVECVGGGGGGGGIVNPTSGKTAGATGGGGGGYAKKMFTAADLSGATTFSYAVGAAGTAGSSSGGDGGAGGNSTFSGTGITTVQGTGGTGGKGDTTGASGNTTTNGRGGGSASGGDINISGGSSESWRGITAASATASRGGAAAYGGGNSLSYVNSYGRPGIAEGGGGGGANATGAETTGSNRVGGVGAEGLVIVTSYFS